MFLPGGADTVQRNIGDLKTVRQVWPLSFHLGFFHLFKSIFFDPLLVGRYRGAFDRYAVYFCRLGGLYDYHVVGFITFLKSQVVVFCFQVYIKFKQDLFIFPR